jgi:hypothetical protein
MACKFAIGQILQESSTFPDQATARTARCMLNRGVSKHFSHAHDCAFLSEPDQFVFGALIDDHVLTLKGNAATGECTIMHVFCKPDPWNEEPISWVYPVPAHNAIIRYCEDHLLRIDTLTFQSEVIYEWDPSKWITGMALPNADGTRAYLLRRPHPPLDRTPEMKTPFERYTREWGGIPTDLVEIDLTTLAESVIRHDDVATGNSVHPHPTDPDLLSFPREYPPLFSWQSDMGRTPRFWTYRVSTGEMAPLTCRNPMKFMMHTDWSGDGRHFYYHGRDRDTGAPVGKMGGGHFIGAMSSDGDVLWEQVFPEMRYGHVSAHTQRNAIIVDGIVCDGLFLAIHYEDLDSCGTPRMELLGHHGSVFHTGNQLAHPHPVMSPDGRWLLFGKSGAEKKGHTHVLKLGD